MLLYLRRLYFDPGKIRLYPPGSSLRIPTELDIPALCACGKSNKQNGKIQNGVCAVEVVDNHLFT